MLEHVGEKNPKLLRRTHLIVAFIRLILIIIFILVSLILIIYIIGFLPEPGLRLSEGYIKRQGCRTLLDCQAIEAVIFVILAITQQIPRTMCILDTRIPRNISMTV